MTIASNNDLDYVKEAILFFHKTMSSNQREMTEYINRTNRGEVFVLHFLSKRDGAVLPSELSAALQASPARISALLGTLEKKGQLERAIDKRNRRNILVTITQAGRGRAEAEINQMKQHLTQIFVEMGEADTTAFNRLLERFFELAQKHITGVQKENK